MLTEPIHSDLEVVKNEYSDRDYDINISLPELTAPK